MREQRTQQQRQRRIQRIKFVLRTSSSIAFHYYYYGGVGRGLVSSEDPFFPASPLCSGTENDANKHSYFIESYDYDLLAHALRSNLVRELLGSLASFRLHLAFVLIFCPKGQDIVVVVAFSNLWTKRLLLSLVYSTCGIPFLVLAKLWFCTALLYRA